jgi:hypothetical protein
MTTTNTTTTPTAFNRRPIIDPESQLKTPEFNGTSYKTLIILLSNFF